MRIPLISGLLPQQRARAESEDSEENNEQAITTMADSNAVVSEEHPTVQRLPGLLGINIYTDASWSGATTANLQTLQLTLDDTHVEDILKQIANAAPRPHRSSLYYLTGLAGFEVDGVRYKFPVRVNLNWFEKHNNKLVFFRPKDNKPQPNNLEEWNVIVSLQQTEPKLENFWQSAEIGTQQLYLRNAQKFMNDITSSKLLINGTVFAKPWMEKQQKKASVNALGAAAATGTTTTLPVLSLPSTGAIINAASAAGLDPGTTKMLPDLSLPSSGAITTAPGAAGPNPGTTKVPGLGTTKDAGLGGAGAGTGTAPAGSQDAAVPPAQGGGLPLGSTGASGPTTVVPLDYLARVKAEAELASAKAEAELYKSAYQGEVEKNDKMRNEHTTEKDSMRTDFTEALKDQQDSTRNMLKEQNDSTRDLVSKVCTTFSAETDKQRGETDKQRELYKEESDKKQKTIDTLAMGLHAANLDPVNKTELSQNALDKAKKTVNVADPPVKTSDAVAHSGMGPKKRRGLAKADSKTVSFTPETPQQKPRAPRSGSVVKQPPKTPSARFKAASGKNVMVVETDSEWDGRVGKLGEMSGNGMFPVTVTSDEFSGTKYFRAKYLQLV